MFNSPKEVFDYLAGVNRFSWIKDVSTKQNTTSLFNATKYQLLEQPTIALFSIESSTSIAIDFQPTYHDFEEETKEHKTKWHETLTALEEKMTLNKSFPENIEKNANTIATRTAIKI